MTDVLDAWSSMILITTICTLIFLMLWQWIANKVQGAYVTSSEGSIDGSYEIPYCACVNPNEDPDFEQDPAERNFEKERILKYYALALQEYIQLRDANKKLKHPIPMDDIEPS